MAEQVSSSRDVARVARDLFGRRLSLLTLDSRTGAVSFVLYDAFAIECSIDERHGTFFGGIRISEQHLVVSTFGRRIIRDGNSESVADGLNQVDEYCRLRLTRPYLEAYESKG